MEAKFIRFVLILSSIRYNWIDNNINNGGKLFRVLPKSNFQTKWAQKCVANCSQMGWDALHMCVMCARLSRHQLLQNWFGAFDNRPVFSSSIRVHSEMSFDDLKIGLLVRAHCDMPVVSYWFLSSQRIDAVYALWTRCSTHLSINNFKILNANVNHTSETQTHLRRNTRCKKQITNLRPKLKLLKPFNINYIFETCINGKHSIRWIYSNNNQKTFGMKPV